jgi:hypothetical protein
MLKKEIIYFEQKALIACDGKCEKAWGTNNRPRIQLSEEDEDDWVWLADTELGLAPRDIGTYECEDGKPRNKTEKLNKWCCRECERCYMSRPNEFDQPIILKDFNNRVYNIPRK